MSRRKEVASQPLRRVVGLVDVEVVPGRWLQHELYECGHTRAPKEDHIGRTNAARRRCFKCHKGLPPDPAFKLLAEKRTRGDG